MLHSQTKFCTEIHVLRTTEKNFSNKELSREFLCAVDTTNCKVTNYWDIQHNMSIHLCHWIGWWYFYLGWMLFNVIYTCKAVAPVYCLFRCTFYFDCKDCEPPKILIHPGFGGFPNTDFSVKQVAVKLGAFCGYFPCHTASTLYYQK